MTPEISTRALLDTLTEGESSESMSLGDLLDRFSARAFGVFLLLAILPSFLPLPMGAGAISGPIVCLVGLQILFNLQHPWVPGFLARRTLQQSTLTKLRDRTKPWLVRLEKLSRPRSEWAIDHVGARIFTGLQLFVLGILLSLPIPLTNYIFGFTVLAFAIALIERDGRLMLIAWTCGVVEIVFFSAFFGQIWDWMAKLLS